MFPVCKICPIDPLYLQHIEYFLCIQYIQYILLLDHVRWVYFQSRAQFAPPMVMGCLGHPFDLRATIAHMHLWANHPLVIIGIRSL